MQSEIERAVKVLLTKIQEAVKADDAVKYTQAACNLANTAVALSNAK